MKNAGMEQNTPYALFVYDPDGELIVDAIINLDLAAGVDVEIKL